MVKKHELVYILVRVVVTRALYMVIGDGVFKVSTLMSPQW